MPRMLVDSVERREEGRLVGQQGSACGQASAAKLSAPSNQAAPADLQELSAIPSTGYTNRPQRRRPCRFLII